LSLSQSHWSYCETHVGQRGVGVWAQTLPCALQGSLVCGGPI
jgi:hypothetical protein